MIVDKFSLPLNQIAFSVLDLRRTEAWWREGLGFSPAGGNRLLMRGPLAAIIQGIPKSATTCWCMVGRNDWAQLEMFQFESPISKLMPADFRPNDIGYTRCGVWVADFDAALARLAKLGSLPLNPPVGAAGQRRACVRNPDGVYVELMEDDPLPAQNGNGRQDCPVAIRSVTMSTPDLATSSAFARDALGLQEADITLHEDAHEAIWGMGDARCERKVFASTNILLEIVQYLNPVGKPWPQAYRICDQGILNICFGDPKNRHGVNALYRQAVAAGARPNSRPIHLPIAGASYVNDALGFSYEFMWARPGIGHRRFGFVPVALENRPELDNQLVSAQIDIEAPNDAVFAVLSDHQHLGDWTGLGQCALVREGERERDGRGAERVLSTPLGMVREQITEWQPNHRYRYRVIKGSPFVGHWGEVSVRSHAGGTQVKWTIRFRSRIPGLGRLFRRVLESKLAAAMARLAKHFEQHHTRGAQS